MLVNLIFISISIEYLVCASATLLVHCSDSLCQARSLIIQMLWVSAANFSYLLLSLANYPISSQSIRASSFLVLLKLWLTNVIKNCPFFPQRGSTLSCDLCSTASCESRKVQMLPKTQCLLKALKKKPFIFIVFWRTFL